MNNIIISIGRQFGSGGRSVGKKLAEKMGIEYYDRELINLAAKEIGFAPEQFEAADEKPISTRFFQALEGAFTSGYPYENYISNDMLFKVQSDVILKLASEKSCVIVGRCSDYVLRDNERCLSVFLHSSTEDKLRRICERTNISEAKALELMRQTDKKRASFYNYYSSKRWGAAETYDLSIDVSILGEDGTVDFIEEFVKRKFEK